MLSKEDAEVFMFGLKNYQWQQHPLLTKHIELGIKMIYDDFESRTCGNCKHYDDDTCLVNFYDEWSDYEMDFYKVSISVPKDFGCNKFEAKDVK